MNNIRLRVQVKEAFKRLSLVHHPDRVPAGERKAAEERFHRISTAYSEAMRQYGEPPLPLHWKPP